MTPAVHFLRRSAWTPCGLRHGASDARPGSRVRYWRHATTERERVTCQRCLVYLSRWPDAV